MNAITFVIFGATGDLTKRKLIPAIYHLIAGKKIDAFLLVLASENITSVQACLDPARAFINDINETVWSTLVNNTVSFSINLNNNQQFTALRNFLDEKEQQFAKPVNRLFYMAIPSFLFAATTKGLGTSGLAQRNPTGVWHRIVYEKPFGNNSAIASAINEEIKHYFDESQIYRVDHYLTKELVSSLVLVRFTNMIFEPLWNNHYIEEVQILMDESIVTKSPYYDQYGVLKDVVQNHGLQLLSLIGMELPLTLKGEHIRDQKAKTLAATSIDDVIIGQYQGYCKDVGVTQSNTPTFAALKLSINTPRWRGVPFYIKAGKALAQKNSSIHIKFKEVPCTLRAQCQYNSNYFSIYIDPQRVFSLQLNIKAPDHLYDVTPIELTFNHDYMQATTAPEAYETLLWHIMQGDQSVVVRADEIMYAWDLIEKITLDEHQIHMYEQKSSGPAALNLFNQKHKIRWRT